VRVYIEPIRKSRHFFGTNRTATRSDDSVQPVALVIESDHGLVDRDVIQRLPGFWL
jgi:hypothetical protein